MRTYELYDLDGGHVEACDTIKECHNIAKGYLEDYIIEVYENDLEHVESRIYKNGKLIKKEAK